MFRFVEETNEREIEDNTPEEGEIQKPAVSTMGSLSMWLHKDPSILQQGRTKHTDAKPGPGEEDLEPEELLRREVAKDPWEKRLKSIKDDQST